VHSPFAPDQSCRGDVANFEEYDRLVLAAKLEGPTTHLILLLGCDAGLRCIEIMGLEWRDVDLGKRQLGVQRSE